MAGPVSRLVRHGCLPTLHCSRKTMSQFLLRRKESSALNKWHLISWFLFLFVLFIFVFRLGFIWKLRSGSAFLQKCYLLWFSGMSCPLSFPKGTVQKVFFHNETQILSSAVSCCDSGIHWFTSKTKTLKNNLFVSTTLIWLIKTHKTVATSVSIISHFNRVYMWNGMWR